MGFYRRDSQVVEVQESGTYIICYTNRKCPRVKLSHPITVNVCEKLKGKKFTNNNNKPKRSFNENRQVSDRYDKLNERN